MKSKSTGIDNPEVLEAVLKAIRSMTREEWLELIAWRPEGYRYQEGELDGTGELSSIFERPATPKLECNPETIIPPAAAETAAVTASLFGVDM